MGLILLMMATLWQNRLGPTGQVSTVLRPGPGGGGSLSRGRQPVHPDRDKIPFLSPELLDLSACRRSRNRLWVPGMAVEIMVGQNLNHDVLKKMKFSKFYFFFFEKHKATMLAALRGNGERGSSSHRKINFFPDRDQAFSIWCSAVLCSVCR